jgi:parallel beta-helix repeat protein
MPRQQFGSNHPIVDAARARSLMGLSDIGSDAGAAAAWPWLNVKDFGALGDGATDDTAAIQAALDAIGELEQTLYFPTGQYKITSTLTYGSSTVLRGEHGQSWLTNYISASPWLMLKPISAAYQVLNITIIDMAFDQRSDVTGFDSSSPCISINEVEGLRITGCVFRKINTMAIWCDTKAADTQTRNVLINGCWIENSEAGGISLFGNIADATIVNCLIENCKDDGIAFQDLATGEFPNGIVIANNQILSCDQRNETGSTPTGIRIFGGTNVVVTGNVIDKVVSCNIMVQEGASTRSSNVVVANNVCRQAGVTSDDTTGVPLVGIYVYNADRVNVIGNEVTDSAAVGIAVTDCDQVLLISNQQHNNGIVNVSITTSTNVQGWMTGAENAVRGGLNVGTSTDQTDGRLTIKGIADEAATQIYIYPSEHATSRRIGITLDQWLIGQDLDANGTKDFFIYDSDSTTRLRISTAGLIYLNGDVSLGAVASLIGLYGAEPVAQATTAIGAATLSGGGGTALDSDSTFDGYTIGQVVKALRDMGVLA